MTYKYPSIAYSILTLIIQVITLTLTAIQDKDYNGPNYDSTFHIFILIYVFSPLTMILAIALLITSCHDVLNRRIDLVLILLVTLLQFGIGSGEIVIV